MKLKWRGEIKYIIDEQRASNALAPMYSVIAELRMKPIDRPAIKPDIINLTFRGTANMNMAEFISYIVVVRK